jgi:hypothetical protein
VTTIGVHRAAATGFANGGNADVTRAYDCRRID